MSDVRILRECATRQERVVVEQVSDNKATSCSHHPQSPTSLTRCTASRSAKVSAHVVPLTLADQY